MPAADPTAGRAPCATPGCQGYPVPGARYCRQCHFDMIDGVPRKGHRAASTPPPALDTGAAPRVAPRPARAPALADYAGAKARAIAPYTTSPAELSEAVLQAEVEASLSLWGYWRRTPKNIRAGPPLKGWQVHLHQCRENPILLDVLLLANDGRYLELELKTATGRATAEQRALLAGREVCRSLAEVRAVVEAWEIGCDDCRPKQGE